MTGKIWITNAYDASNLGDELLLNETIGHVASRSDDHQLTIISNHPDSISDASHSVTRTPGWAGREYSTIKRGLHGVVRMLGFSPVDRDSAPDGVVAMAGGYTAIPNLASTVLYANDHLGMIDLPRKYNIPGLMMPVSVGPLSALARARLKPSLAAYQRVFVRDAESLHELRELNNVSRVPDLAVQLVSRTDIKVNECAQAKVLMIARDLDRGQNPSYDKRIRELTSRLDARGGVQVPKDVNFYKRLGIGYDRGSIEYSEMANWCAATVSVRLHGSIMSILNGVPSIHLSYDRKGLGAFSDLGIGEWLHDARTFDLDLVSQQVNSLRQNADRYWDCISRARSKIISVSAVMDDAIEEFLARVDARAASKP